VYVCKSRYPSLRAEAEVALTAPDTLFLVRAARIELQLRNGKLLTAHSVMPGERSASLCYRRSQEEALDVLANTLQIGKRFYVQVWGVRFRLYTIDERRI